MTIPYVPTRRLARVVLATALLWLLPVVVSAPWASLVPIVALEVLAVACIADAALTPGRRALVVERVVPGAIGVGDTVQGTYTVRALWPLSLRGELYDTLPEALTRAETRRA